MRNQWPYTATINDDRRAIEWEAVLGTRTIPILSPIPRLVNLPGKDNALVYMLDWTKLERPELNALIGYLAGKFDLAPNDVEESLPEHGVPILADNVTVTVYQPGMFFYD